MKQIATVERILQRGMAEISVVRQSACAHNCGECAGCGVSAAPVHAVAQNPIHAEAGQKVIVESSTQQVIHMVLLVYLVPVILFFAGYFAVPSQEGTGMRIAVSVACFFCGFVPAVLYDRRIRKKGGVLFTIVRLF